MRTEFAAWSVVAVVACDDSVPRAALPTGRSPAESAAGSAAAAALGDGVVAKVGDDSIPADLVGRVARANGVSPEDARDRLIRDALFARAAAESRADVAGVGERGVLARALLDRVEAEARGAPPSDQEIAELTRARWLDFDRPESVRTTHFVALAESEDERAAARDVASRFAEAAAGVTDSKAFHAAASAFEGGDVKTKVEDLAPVCADGRIADLADRPPPGSPPRTLVEPFAAAAHAIPAVGGQSGIVATDFGFHVILLVERVPEQRVPLSERRNVMAAEVFSERARKTTEQLLVTLRISRPVEVERALDDLTRRIAVE